jgi:flagella basal body P-ring formation protein FlgA
MTMGAFFSTLGILAAWGSAAVVEDRSCTEAAVDIEQGAAVFADDVRSVACRHQQVSGLFAYDRATGDFLARRSIAAGSYLGRLRPTQRPVVRTGDRVIVAARVGTVTIRRSVRALQSARAGQTLFVMDEDGQIFVAPQISIEQGDR